ncbi:helix-turn-helix domain-containing protein [Paenibacillus sp. HJL G12]|uniref:Helix-turn-helix domain-containing protein n=1 Tax=Paenibacillus dendrobii TaxID=2691084 RepID=A0A7X3IND5_9BACL|nr:helix-turn-helix transcriptional regulator [Paenibacillus dendrobii]MWV47142.1 helix-turn-helix domain-containing protein [Paenibacillus dendrobii]
MTDKDILLRVGARIRELRKEKGFTQEALGEKGGFHFSYIGQIERGEKNVALLNLAKIAEALEVDISQLFIQAHREDSEETQADIQEINYMLNQQNPQKVAMAKNVVKEIFNYK